MLKDMRMLCESQLKISLVMTTSSCLMFWLANSSRPATPDSPVESAVITADWTKRRSRVSSRRSGRVVTVSIGSNLAFQVPARNAVCNINCCLLLVRPVAYFTRGAWTVAPSRRRLVGSLGWFIVEILFMVRVCSQVGYRRWVLSSLPSGYQSLPTWNLAAILILKMAAVNT